MLSFGLNSFAFLAPRNRIILARKIPALGHRITVHRARSLRNVFLSVSLSLDTPESRPSVDDGVQVDSVAEDDIHDKYKGYLDDATIVSVPLPLDVYLEESVKGKVYVDEVIPEGNAAKTGCISKGDIVIAVSLPFGDALYPVPPSGGLDLVQEYISDREEGLEFKMALIPSDVKALRQEDVDAQNAQMTLAKMEEVAKKVFIDEYPFAPSDERKAQEGELDLDILRKEGFDI